MGLMVSAQKINDPNAEVREAKNFHGVNVSNAFDVYLTQSNEEAVAVSASEIKFRDRIKVEVRSGILHIRYENEGLKWNNGKQKLKAYISIREIDQLTISGACDVFVEGTIKAQELTLHQSGASDLKGKLDVKKLTVDISGASDVTITGSASILNIGASGASSFKGYDLVTENCEAHASGASDIRITVNGEISARASGASDIKFKGSGVIRELKSSGASSVSKG